MSSSTPQQTPGPEIVVKDRSDGADGRITSGAGVRDVKVPKLTEENYRTWSKIMKNNLIGKKLWSIVIGRIVCPDETRPSDLEAWEFNNATAMTYIMTAVDDRQLQHIIRLDTANDQWETLNRIHRDIGLTRLIPLSRRLCGYKAGPSDSVEQIASELRTIAAVMAEIRPGEEPSEFLLARILMDSIDGTPYAMARALLEDKGEITMTMVIEKYKEVESRNKDEISIPEIANKASSSRKFTGKCFYCDKAGHIKTDCFQWLKTDEGREHKRKNENAYQTNDSKRRGKSSGSRGRKTKKSDEARLTQENDARSEESDSEYARAATEVEDFGLMAQNKDAVPAQEEFALVTRNDDAVPLEKLKEWVIDSGASRHMTPDRGIFVNMMLIRTTVRVADGTVISSIGRGDILIRMRNGEKIRLTEVLYVPELDTNLLSIRALQTKGISARFGLNGVEITRGDALLATGVLIGSSYLLRPAREDVALVTDMITTKKKHIPNPNRDGYLLWHARMGHVGPGRLEKLPFLTTGVGNSIKHQHDGEKCVTCKYTKMTKIISRMPPLKATRRGERTYSDYWGPYKVMNLQGSQYFLSFIDDYTRRSEVYFGPRSSLRENFYRYKAKFEAETGEKLALIRSDNAKEYHALKKDLLNEGILMEFTDPYTPEQNGVAERMNRTLMQMVRAMQLWAGLPREFWGEALMVANYLRNRLPTNTHGGKMTPYEAWYGRKPDLNHIRTYGCLVHARIPSEKRDKMDVVSFQGIFVGYHSSKQYRVYNPVTKKIGWHAAPEFFEDWPGGPLLNAPSRAGTRDYWLEMRGEHTSVIWPMVLGTGPGDDTDSRGYARA